MVTFNAEQARKTDRAYNTPDMARQRLRTLELLQPRADEHVLDVGCGTGLLAQELAALVGPGGRVVGIDVSRDMLDLAEGRCSDMTQVQFVEGSATSLPDDGGGFDGVTCTQVLLYVAEVELALAEMHRVLKPGGRIVIVETDWRGLVLNSFDGTLTRKMIAAWDQAVASPNLPTRLGPLLRAQGFHAVRAEALPILSTSYVDGGWPAQMAQQFAHYARDQDAVTGDEADAWLDDLACKGADGSFFFCVNRFFFVAVRVASGNMRTGASVVPSGRQELLHPKR